MLICRARFLACEGVRRHPRVGRVGARASHQSGLEGEAAELARLTLTSHVAVWEEVVVV